MPLCRNVKPTGGKNSPHRPPFPVLQNMEAGDILMTQQFNRECDSMLKVVQCWDDGVINDIRLTDLLRRWGAKATFNLNPGFHSDERGVNRWAGPGYSGWSCRGFLPGKVGRKEMKEIYSGFRVASHCFRHETVGTLPDDKFVQAAIDARTWLEDLFQCECPGFAWPCGRYTPETCRALREAGFAYGRTTQNSSDVAGCEETMALHPSCHFQANDFYGRYEEAKKTGIFYFWGHSYEMQEYDELWRQLEMKIQFISEDPDSVWADVIDIVPECHRRGAR